MIETLATWTKSSEYNSNKEGEEDHRTAVMEARTDQKNDTSGGEVVEGGITNKYIKNFGRQINQCLAKIITPLPNISKFLDDIEKEQKKLNELLGHPQNSCSLHTTTEFPVWLSNFEEDNRYNRSNLRSNRSSSGRTNAGVHTCRQTRQQLQKTWIYKVEHVENWGRIHCGYIEVMLWQLERFLNRFIEMRKEFDCDEWSSAQFGMFVDRMRMENEKPAFVNSFPLLKDLDINFC